MNLAKDPEKVGESHSEETIRRFSQQDIGGRFMSWPSNRYFVEAGYDILTRDKYSPRAPIRFSRQLGKTTAIYIDSDCAVRRGRQPDAISEGDTDVLTFLGKEHKN